MESKYVFKLLDWQQSNLPVITIISISMLITTSTHNLDSSVSYYYEHWEEKVEWEVVHLGK